MSSTVRTSSFKNVNLRERTELAAVVAAGIQQITVASTQGYAAGDIIYVGALSREGCERAVVLSLTGETIVNLATPLKQPHAQFEPVTGVLGDRIQIRRAINVDDKPPSLEAYTVLGNRAIDPDQAQTYYTDSTGGAGYWYLTTYLNELTNDETTIDLSTALRGDDFGHYAYIEEIRRDAGFENAVNLKDYDIDSYRRNAESEVNAALAQKYTVPFKPVPEIIHTLTLRLASALLQDNAYGTSKTTALVTSARAMLKQYSSGDVPISDGDGTSLNTDEGVAYDFGEEPRAFTIGQTF